MQNLFGCSPPGGNYADDFSFKSLAKNNQKDSQLAGEPNPNISGFFEAVFRVKELHGPSVCPYRLSFFKPNPVFPVIDPILIILPFISHKSIVCLCIYFINKASGSAGG
jgi:hypothetical protein